VLALETDIAAQHWDRVRSRDRTQTHNPMDRARLNELLPAELWDAWLTGMQAPDGLLDNAEVMQPSFFTAMRELLVPERLDDWKVWLSAKVIRAAAPYASDAIVEQNFDFYGRTLSGIPQLKERWKRGVALVEGCVGEALGEVYVQRHFAPEAKARMDELVENLLVAYRHNISELAWMTSETKNRALEKLAAFMPKIGYPQKFRDYAGLVIARDDLIGNVRRAAAQELDRELDKVGSPVDRAEWFMTPQTVNAYYNPGMNEIVFPAAILRPPFFDPAAGDATNYGGIGAVIGHEIGHGFDDQGSKYDGTGALRDWWTAADRTAFDGLTNALIEQYSGLSPADGDGAKVNGALTVGENIGDLGGLGIAYQAWLIARSGESPTVEEAQEFFTNWARCWRAKTRPEEVARRLAIDPHSPPEFRCNQVVRNLDEFYAAFDVRPSDRLWLDPADRVRIW
jgi:putative endopeptidase